MRAVVLLAVLALLAFSFTSTASAQLTVCQNYSSPSNATLQAGLLTAIVVRAAIGSQGGNFTSPQGVNYTIPGLFNSAGPLYAIFSGQQQYRVGAPNYTNTSNPALGVLVNHLVAYFGALFGCNATGYPAVNNYNMYQVHANMSINSTQENYFNTQLALTLLSFGVDPAVVNYVAAPALGLFNRCGAPIAALSASAPVQICGTPDCPLATGATNATCATYYGFSSSSSSSTGGSVPSGGSTYPLGSLVVPFSITFGQGVSASQGANAVASDVAYNIAAQANAQAPNANYTQAQIQPYVVVYQFNTTQLGPSSRRLLQTNSSTVPVRVVILGNLTTVLTGLPVATAAGYLVSAINAHNFTTIALNTYGASVPVQTTTAATPGSLPVSSSTGIYAYSSSTGNGAAGKYAAGGLFVAAAAVVASLLL